jgi:uncharacterized membrane protein
MRPRWLVIGLVASLALNLFLIGTGAGVVALGMRMAREPGTGRPAAGALFWATEGLPQPDRRAMRQMLRGLRDQAKGDTDRSRALRVAAWSALAEPTPDVGAIDQKLAQSRQTDIAVRSRAEQQIVDYAARLPPADRAIFAAGMRRVLGASASASAPRSAAVNDAAK